MILKVAKIWENLSLNYLFASIGDFSRELTTITFVYLVNLIMILHFKQIELIIRYKAGYIILAQIESELSICSKRYFLEKLTVTFVYLLYSFIIQHLKKILNEKYKRQEVA